MVFGASYDAQGRAVPVIRQAWDVNVEMLESMPPGCSDDFFRGHVCEQGGTVSVLFRVASASCDDEGGSGAPTATQSLSIDASAK